MKLVLALVLVAACGGKTSEPTTTSVPSSTPAPTASAISPEECVQQGGQVRGDIGDGQVACQPGERDLGRVNQGIEGAVCCAAPPLGPTP